MARAGGPTRTALAVRGAAFVVVGVGVAILMVLRGTGGLDRDATVSVDLPAEAGLITGEAPVRYAGVNVGRIAAIDAGPSTSTVRLSIGREVLDRIPADVVARVVPRTFFGDIYIQLVPAGAVAAMTLADGDRIDADTGPDAVALYDIYTRMFDILDRMQPQQVQVALTAIGRAVDGRGDRIGASIDHWSSAADTLAPALRDLLNSTPDLVTVLDAIDRAAPDTLDMLASATSLSRQLADHRESFDAALTSAAGFAPVVDAFLDTNRESLTTVIDASGAILATTAANADGLTRTIDQANSFGRTAAVVFSSGRFDITAVPSFSDPLPYGPADCPRYGAMTGPNCGAATGTAAPRTNPLSDAPGAAQSPLDSTRVVDPTVDSGLDPGVAGVPGAVPAVPGPVVGPGPIVDPAAEAPILDLIERHLGITVPASSEVNGPEAASVVMLGPLIRGTEVTLR